MKYDKLIEEARKDGIVRFVAGGIIPKKNGSTKILVLKRAKGGFMPDIEELPSGVVEQGESLFDALCREVKEETGLDISSDIEYFNSFDYKCADGTITRQFNFLVKPAKGFIELSPTEHIDFR